MSHRPDRIAQLEARIAELEAARAAPRPEAARPSTRRPSAPLLRRLALIGLCLALLAPASVALANHRFNDVPTNHQFHAAISAIADAGITSGCPQGTNNYCPDGLVTRGQMAAFLSRLGALQPGSAPKVNADRVDGRHVREIVRVANWQTANSTPIPATNTVVQYGPDLVITAPTSGFVTLNIGFTILNSSCTASCTVSGTLRHAETGTTTIIPGFANADTTEALGSGSINHVFAVGPGTNTFRLLLQRSGNGAMDGWYGTGTAMFSLFGPDGTSTLGLSAGEGEHAKVGDPLDH